MKHYLFETDLITRIIEREGDEDFFIETESYPLNFKIDLPGISRMQFPLSRAILIRTTPVSQWVTVHVLRDVDLFSSFVNFEINLEGKKLIIKKEEGYITMAAEDRPA